MTLTLDAIDHLLIDTRQRDFPLVAYPYTAIGVPLGISETAVIERLKRYVSSGLATRVGAVLAPNTIGSSTLAAIAVPADRMEAVAAIVDAEPGVNHNYEREHAFNMWFVVTGADRAAVDATLARIAERTGHPVLDLPMLCAYHIDLGFPIGGKRAMVDKTVRPPCTPDTTAIEPTDRALLQAIEDGLPLVPRPYLAVAEALGTTEDAVIERLTVLTRAGIVRRLGIVVRHRAVGYQSNAMAVWQVDPETIDDLGAAFAAHPSVTLCYRRRPAEPDWPYNLFVMVHATERGEARDVIAELNAANETGNLLQTVLFSRRCFKQRGARIGQERRVA